MRLDKALKTFESKLTLPYLFKSPIGSELKLNIFKKDSTFTTAEQSVNLFYQLNPKQRLFVGIKTAQSNALEPIESSTIIDYLGIPIKIVLLKTSCSQ